MGYAFFEPLEQYKIQRYTALLKCGVSFGGRKELKFIDTDVTPGNLVDFKFPDRKGMYLITAIMEPSDYAKIDYYQKLFNVYASGDMNNPKFVIKPNYKKDAGQLKNILSRIFKR